MPDFSSFTLTPGHVAVALAACLGGFMRGFVGFGGALVVVPVLSVVFGPRAAVAISSIMSFPAALQLLPEAIRHSERPFVIPMGLTIMLTAPLGSWLLVLADPKLMSMVIAGLVIVMTAMLGSGKSFKRKVGMTTLIAAGAAGGLVQGIAGIGGPPVVAVTLAKPGTPRQQRANVLGVMTAIALSSIAPLIYFGFYTKETIAIGLILLPLYVGSTALGSRYFMGSGQGYYRTAALATLSAIGLATLLVALRDYLAG